MMQMAERPVCDYEGSDYQEVFWDQGGRAYEDRCEEIALRRLLPEHGKQMLEIGAGAGRNTARYNGYEKIVLLDYAHTQLMRAQQLLGRSQKYTYVIADAYRLPFAAGVFDGATMIRTLHHMVDPQAVLNQTRSVLQPDGMFLLEFANKQNIKAIMRWWLRRQEWNPFDHSPVEYTHLNFDFHPRAVRSWLNDAGFTIERLLTVSHFRIGLLKSIVPSSILAAMDSVAQLTGNWWQLSPSVFVRARVIGADPVIAAGAFWRCPACRSLQMDEGEASVDCVDCGKRWPIRDGIYDFKDPLP